MTAVRTTLFEALGGAAAGGSVALAAPWEPLGVGLLGKEVAPNESEPATDLEMIRGWWLEGSGRAEAPVHQLLLEFRLRTEGTAFRCFEETWGANWIDEFFERLRGRVKQTEHELFVVKCPETGAPVAHLKMAWLEVWEWDALDQHPGRRKWFDLVN